MNLVLLDTSVLIALRSGELRVDDEYSAAISTPTLAELAVGVHRASDEVVRARRLAYLQFAEESFLCHAFDAAAAKSYGLVVAAINASGRQHRGRAVDLFIASIAHCNGLDLMTHNQADFRGLQGLVSVIAV